MYMIKDLYSEYITLKTLQKHKRFEQTFYQRRYANNVQAHEKMPQL